MDDWQISASVGRPEELHRQLTSSNRLPITDISSSAGGGEVTSKCGALRCFSPSVLVERCSMFRIALRASVTRRRGQRSPLDGACGPVRRDRQAGAGKVNRTQKVAASGMMAISSRSRVKVVSTSRLVAVAGEPRMAPSCHRPPSDSPSVPLSPSRSGLITGEIPSDANLA